jgi:hypothetical protein
MLHQNMKYELVIRNWFITHVVTTRFKTWVSAFAIARILAVRTLLL